MINNSIYKSLPWELKAMIIKTFPQSHLEYFIEKYPNKLWNWYTATKNVSINFIHKHPNFPWFREAIEKNASLSTCRLTRKIVEKNILNKDLLLNPNIFDFLNKFPKLHSDILSENKGLTIDILIKYKNIRWRWHMVLQNPNIIKPIFDKKFPDHFDLLQELSNNYIEYEDMCYFVSLYAPTIPDYNKDLCMTAIALNKNLPGREKEKLIEYLS